MTRIVKVELFIVDDDNLGTEEITTVLENQNYPNHCIYPRVASIVERDVEWRDDHPLNRPGWQKAFAELFGDAAFESSATRDLVKAWLATNTLVAQPVAPSPETLAAVRQELLSLSARIVFLRAANERLTAELKLAEEVSLRQAETGVEMMQERDAAREQHRLQQANYIALVMALYGGRLPDFEYDPLVEAKRLRREQLTAARVNRILLRVCQVHDGSELWKHTARDPESFREAVRLAMREDIP